MAGYDDASLQSDSSWWSTTLELPRIAKFSDDEMENHFDRYDGKWSTQTKDAVARFEADGVELNENWALTPQSWACPCCRRAKADIFRLSSRKVLLAKLEIHHDHIRDAVFKRAKGLCGNDDEWDVKCRDGGAHIMIDNIRELVVRFPHALVCSECNAADGAVKAQVGTKVHTLFTFTPSEIASFIVAKAHHDHEVLFDRAEEIWRDQEPRFRFRLGLLDQLIHHVLSGALSLDRSAGVGTVRTHVEFTAPALLFKAFNVKEDGTQRRGFLHATRAEFVAKSTSRGFPRSQLRASSGAPVSIPSDGELDRYIDPVSTQLWRSTPDSWECPVCHRNKRSIIRWSNRKRLRGSIRAYTVHSEERDPHDIQNRIRLLPSFDNQRFISGESQVHICSDCAEVRAHLIQEDPSLGQPIFSLDDIRASIVVSAAHHPHDVDYAVAAERAAANEPYQDALIAYRAFVDLRGLIVFKYKRMIANGWEHDGAVTELACDLGTTHDIRDEFEAQHLVLWLLDQRG